MREERRGGEKRRKEEEKGRGSGGKRGGKRRTGGEESKIECDKCRCECKCDKCRCDVRVGQCSCDERDSAGAHLSRARRERVTGCPAVQPLLERTLVTDRWRGGRGRVQVVPH